MQTLVVILACAVAISAATFLGWCVGRYLTPVDGRRVLLRQARKVAAGLPGAGVPVEETIVQFAPAFVPIAAGLVVLIERLRRVYRSHSTGKQKRDVSDQAVLAERLLGQIAMLAIERQEKHSATDRLAFDAAVDWEPGP